jgi:hypothetical protein
MNFDTHINYKPELLLQLLESEKAHYWVMDTETDGLDVLGEDSRNTAHYIGLMPMTRSKEIIPHCFIVRGEDWHLYREKVERDIILVGHNLRFDLHATNTFPNLATYDTMVMAYHASTTSRHGMDHMCAVRGWPKIKTPDLIKKGRILECPEEDIVRYLADDVYTTCRLFKDVRESGSDWKTERAVHRMESRGLLLLPDKLAQVAADVDQLVNTSYGWLVEAGWPQAGNLNSPAQVSEWLTERGARTRLRCSRWLTEVTNS